MTYCAYSPLQFTNLILGDQFLNILFVGRSFFRGGGSATRLISIIDTLGQEHKVFVLTIAPANEQLWNSGKRNISIINCPIKPRLTIIPFLSAVNMLLTFSYLRSLLQRLNVDVIVASIPEFEEGLATAIASRRKTSRMVIDVGDLIVDDHVAAVYRMFPESARKVIRLILRTLLVKAINTFDCAVTVTPTLRQAMIKEGICIPIHVITNGADTSLFQRASAQMKIKLRKELNLDGKFLILYAGAMGVDYYPMEVIFDAFKIVTKNLPDARLILCGSWNKRMDQLTAKFGKYVKYLGFLKLSDMARVMQACDIGLITMDERPSTKVALTTKFFEYLASGLPVVASVPTGGELDRLIAAELVGYSVAPLDYRSMADRLIQLLRNDAERQVLVDNGFKLVTTKFDRARLATDFLNILLSPEVREM
jgi:glycosyltransferase involved in cell wall biosynthesis